MKILIWIAALMAVTLGSVDRTSAQVAITPQDAPAIIKAMDNAMEPGEGQKRLDFLVGTFDVKVLIWIDPSKPPNESQATSVASWVLGHRYVQQMLTGYVLGERWDGIGYAGYDNLAKTYVACYMDSGSTGMEWYTGAIDADGKLAKLTATTTDAITFKPTKLEMRLSIDPNGDHVTSLWQEEQGGKMVKIMELQFKRKHA
jgi:hypothetical protein